MLCGSVEPKPRGAQVESGIAQFSSGMHNLLLAANASARDSGAALCSYAVCGVCGCTWFRLRCYLARLDSSGTTVIAVSGIHC